jgi:GNAT superfamily N-acetyltransferase
MSLGNPERPVGGLAVRPPPGVELRPVGRDDLADVVAMARQLHGFPPYEHVEALQPRLDAVINSADAAPYVAVEAGEPVGLGVLEFRRRLNFPTFEGWLSELYVRPAARGRGIGRALLDALVAEWRLRGSHRLQAHVPAQADAAVAVLSAAGLEEWMLNFRLRPIKVRDTTRPADLAIRPLTGGDGAVVTRLLSEFGPQRTPSPDRMEAVLRTFADHARRVQAGIAASTVAELDGKVVGICVLEWRHPFWTNDTHAWVPDLLVTEHARGRGIGRALLADALATADNRGAAQLTLESGRGRAAAHALYRSMGFEEAGRTFLLRRAEPS